MWMKLQFHIIFHPAEFPFCCEMQWITALLWILNFILELWCTEPVLQLVRTPENNLFPTRSYFHNLQSSTCPLSTSNWRLKLQPFKQTDQPSKCFLKKLATTWNFVLCHKSVFPVHAPREGGPLGSQIGTEVPSSVARTRCMCPFFSFRPCPSKSLCTPLLWDLTLSLAHW